MRIAVLGNAGSWYVADLERAAAARGHELQREDFATLAGNVGDVKRNDECPETLSNFDAVVVRSMPPGSLEQVVFRMDLLGRLEAQGTTVLNSPRSLECAIDKYLTTARLHAAGLPVPRTVTCQDEETAMQAFDSLGGDVWIRRSRNLSSVRSRSGVPHVSSAGTAGCRALSAGIRRARRL